MKNGRCLTAVANGIATIPVDLITAQFRRYQFTGVEVVTTTSPTLVAIRNAHVLLVGMDGAHTTGVSRALTLSRSPCIFWLETWDLKAAQYIKKYGAQYRTHLVIASNSVKRVPLLSDATRVIHAPDMESKAYEIALAIMTILMKQRPGSATCSGGC